MQNANFVNMDGGLEIVPQIWKTLLRKGTIERKTYSKMLIKGERIGIYFH